MCLFTVCDLLLFTGVFRPSEMKTGERGEKPAIARC